MGNHAVTALSFSQHCINLWLLLGNYCLLLDMFELYDVINNSMWSTEFFLKTIVTKKCLLFRSTSTSGLILNLVDFARKNVQKVNTKCGFFLEIKIIILLFSN